MEAKIAVRELAALGVGAVPLTEAANWGSSAL